MADSSPNPGDAPPTEPQSSPRAAPEPAPHARPGGLMMFLSEKRIDLALNVERFSVIVFSILYLIGLGGNDAFYKALLAMAAASALRLYQRTMEPANRGAGRTYAQLFQTLLMEDSCHYLFYCILFLMGSPVTFVLLPICIIALLHSVTFFSKVSNELNFGVAILRPVARLVETEQQRMLMTAAVGEIMMMPVSVVMVFSGKLTLVAPILYYRFLQLRYRSRRNPYCRQAFTQLRMLAQQGAARSPPFLANIIYKGIGLVSRLAPQVPA